MYGEQRRGADPHIRVLWLIKGLGPGGAEQLLLQAARVVDRERFDYSIAYVRPDKTHLVPEFEALGILPYRLGSKHGGRLGWLRELRSMIQDADVVHVHSPVLAAATRIGSRTVAGGRRPVVVTTEHNEWTSHRLPTRLANALTEPLDAQTWAVSDQVKETVWRPLAGRYEVLIHGIDGTSLLGQRATREEVRRELGLHDDEIMSLTVANLRRNKDYPNLLAAAERAVALEPRLRFISVGQGPLESELGDLHRQTRLGESFMFLGFRRDIPALMAAADVFTLSSAHEGLPVAIMEAFAMGLPVVATAVGGIPQHVRDGIDGRVVPPGDPNALADALVALAQDPAARRRMSESVRSRAPKYDIRSAVATIEQRYAELASAGASRK
ncbi:glycosyltransferase [Nostocoides sp. F2B08]|uniref:glycosyltransferase n=1 Tax=Nostocoides sp. F2B08 TaxID=2653936 RepID=UPI001D044DBC|nr:glycosyltransferase [Tetrasphaera sp. F2B08]